MDRGSVTPQGARWSGRFLFRNVRNRPARGEPAIASPRPQRIWVEALFWGLALLLVSPLAIYAGSDAMPMWALFSVAAGIALSLALAGRQMHEVLLADSLSRRKGATKRALVAGGLVLVMLLVLVGLVVATFVLRSHGVARSISVP